MLLLVVTYRSLFRRPFSPVRGGIVELGASARGWIQSQLSPLITGRELLARYRCRASPRGIDVTTTPEMGLLGAIDEDQLLFSGRRPGHFQLRRRPSSAGCVQGRAKVIALCSQVLTNQVVAISVSVRTKS